MISDIEVVHPVDEGWHHDVISRPEFKYRVLFEPEPSEVIRWFRNDIRYKMLANRNCKDGEDFLFYASSDGLESCELYLTSLTTILTMRLTGDETIQYHLKKIQKIEERE